MTATQMQQLDRATHSRRRSTLLPLALAALAFALLLATMGTLIVRSQQSARGHIESNFSARGTSSAGVVSTFIGAQAQGEEQTARRFLTGAVTPRLFDFVASAFGTRSALLLDAHGRVLAAEPDDAVSAGTSLAGRYAYLDAAAAGRVAVSGVLPASGGSEPQAAIAVPFSSTHGRRVFSAAYPVWGGTMQAFVRHVVVQSHAAVYLVDAQGRLLAASPAVSATTLAGASPTLAAAAARPGSGSVTIRGVPTSYTVAPVSGTDWRMVIAEPSAGLFASIAGATTWVPWLVFALVAVLALGLLATFAGFLAERGRLAGLSAEVLQMARTDPLTGLPNRRALAEGLAQGLARAKRYNEPLSVLMIDLDNFKEINDTHGHGTGDRALRAVAACLGEVLRDCDIYGRWGGDEFLAILGHTPAEGAREAAQRLCQRSAALNLWSIGLDHGISLSVGCASAATDVGELLDTADAAMYEAKRAGRGGVCVAPPAAV